MEKEKYLPLGTVVLLKNAKKPMMILGYKTAPNSKEVYLNGKTQIAKDIYDYCGCVYPEGVVNSMYMCMFDHDQIDKILYMGYCDELYQNYKEKLKDDKELQKYFLETFKNMSK